MDTTEDIKERIRQAAMNRFRTYGFGKTTMAEIAGDCDMSAANLYRFFKNKQDIAAALAELHFKNEEQVLRVVVRDSTLSPREKIERFVLTTLEITLTLHNNEPKINEMVEHICQNCTELIATHKSAKQSLLAEILAEGVRTGDFAVDDIMYTAEIVCKAIIIFDFPLFVDMFPQEKMELWARGVSDLLITGLGTR